jgi:hypothetical protein
MTLRDAGFFLRGRLNRMVARSLNRRASRSSPATLPLEAVLALAEPSPLDVARLLEGLPNAERQAQVARYLRAKGVSFETHQFHTFEGAGENYCVEVGTGDPVFLVIAHHDAVPGSAGANDNAAAVGILLALLARATSAPPRRLRLRLLFTAGEELGYLGARAWVRARGVSDVAAVLSLELCGIGDTPVLWDAGAETELSRAFEGAARSLGYRRDETYHTVGRIPVFGSDHRAFAAAGIPAHGLTVVPGCEVDALRRFVLSPWRGVVRQVVRRPPPFDTYHTARDRSETLDPGALARVGALLDALIDTYPRG